MGKKKTPEQIADEERRYRMASGAHTPEEFEQFFDDPNQAIRATAAMNPDADADALARFAKDRFWGVRIEVASHRNATREILLSMLEPDPRKRGVVHHAVKDRLVAEGVVFGEHGMPVG